jgi:hypothetical protein
MLSMNTCLKDDPEKMDSTTGPEQLFLAIQDRDDAIHQTTQFRPPTFIGGTDPLLAEHIVLRQELALSFFGHEDLHRNTGSGEIA